MDGFLNLVHDKMELISLAYDELKTAISDNFSYGDNNPVAEIPVIVNSDEATEPAATGPQPFNFDEFEMKLRDKFIAAFDELLKGLKETIYVHNNLVAKGDGAAYASLSQSYDQMMGSNVSKNHGSEHETIKTLA